jgi:hypothetical protein
VLKAGTEVTLLREMPVERYCQVRAPSTSEGWVYGPNIDLPSSAAGPTPELPACEDDSDDHSRQAMKTRAASTATPKVVTVGQILQWVVPTGLPSSARRSNDPIANRETVGDVYELTGFVRVVRFQADCDFHVQVASSTAQSASQVIVEIPCAHDTAQGQLMALLGLKDEQKAKSIAFPKEPPRLTFVGFAFLDQWHQTKIATKAGFSHGPATVKTLWELHPIFEVRRP